MADVFSGRVPEQFELGVVGAEDDSVGTDPMQADRGVVERIAQFLLASLELIQRLDQLSRLPLQLFLGSNQVLVGALPGKEDGPRVLQGHRTQQIVLVVSLAHLRLPIIPAASAVPATRARILAKAVSRVVDVSS